MGSLLSRQTSTNKFAPLKSIKNLFPVPVGGVITKGEAGNPFTRPLDSHAFIMWYIVIMSSSVREQLIKDILSYPFLDKLTLGLIPC